MLDVELLDPTDENALEAFSQNYLFRSDRVLETIYALYSPQSNRVIAINGDWGSGKTFFTKEIEAVLKPKHEDQLKKVNDFIEPGRERYHHVVYVDQNGKENTDFPTNLIFPFYYDAWLHDYDGDPMLSLVLALTEYFTVEPVVKGKTVDQIRKLTAPIVKHLTKGSVDLGEFDVECKESSLSSGLKIPRSAKSLKQEIEKYIEEIRISTNRPQLVILIDELDRCRPDFAVDLLEGIKHYFNCPGISFVFSVNLTQLEHSIKHRYGSGFDARRYLKRFFDLELKLPQISSKSFNEYYDYPWNNLNLRILNALCDQYSLSLRDRIQLHNKLGLIDQFHISSSVDCWVQDFVDTVIIPVLLVLDFVEEEKKQEFLQGQNPDPLTCLVKQECAYDLANFMSDSSQRLNVNNLSRDLESIYNYLFVDGYSRKEDLTVGRLHFQSNQMPSVIEKFNFVLV